MDRDGVQQALGVVLAAYSSYSSCRQYREDIEQARRRSATAAPTVDKMRVFYNHPDFVAANADRVREALDRSPPSAARSAHLAFTAHSIPSSMAGELRLREATDRDLPPGRRDRRASVPTAGSSSTRAGAAGRPTPGSSPTSSTISTPCTRAGRVRRRRPPGRVPVRSHGGPLRPRRGGPASVRSLGLNMVRAATVGTHPRFVAMLRELIVERIIGSNERRAIGQFGRQPRRLPGRLLPSRRRGQDKDKVFINRFLHSFML